MNPTISLSAFSFNPANDSADIPDMLQSMAEYLDTVCETLAHAESTDPHATRALRLLEPARLMAHSIAYAHDAKQTAGGAA